jgi:hypothetical protein
MELGGPVVLLGVKPPSLQVLEKDQARRCARAARRPASPPRPWRPPSSTVLLARPAAALSAHRRSPSSVMPARLAACVVVADRRRQVVQTCGRGHRRPGALEVPRRGNRQECPGRSSAVDQVEEVRRRHFQQRLGCRGVIEISFHGCPPLNWRISEWALCGRRAPGTCCSCGPVLVAVAEALHHA